MFDFSNPFTHSELPYLTNTHFSTQQSLEEALQSLTIQMNILSAQGKSNENK